MMRVVHLFDLEPDVNDEDFLNWLDGRLESATKQFGCLERHTWIFLSGFEDSYFRPKSLGKGDRPRYVNEAYWPDVASADRFREWLTTSEEGRDLHDRWFRRIRNHTVLRYVEGWSKVRMTDG